MRAALVSGLARDSCPVLSSRLPPRLAIQALTLSEEPSNATPHVPAFLSWAELQRVRRLSQLVGAVSGLRRFSQAAL